MLLGILALPPILLGFVLLYRQKQLGIASRVSLALWPLIILGSALFILVAVLLVTLEVTVDEKTLEVNGIWPYSAAVDKTDIMTAERCSPKQVDQLLATRTNGISTGVMRIGWFSSPQGRKIYAAKGTRSESVCITTTSGFDLVLTPASATNLQQELQHR
jgi:hypothetical protein